MLSSLSHRLDKIVSISVYLAIVCAGTLSAQTYTDLQTYSTHFNSVGLALADLNGDTHLDLFIANRGQSAQPIGEDNGTPNEIFFNNGAGIFTPGQNNLGLRNSMDVALGDLDGDGDIDAFVVNAFENNNVAQSARYDENVVWINQGFLQGGTEGVFAQGWTDGLSGLGADTSFEVWLDDFDGDGDLDAVLATAVSGISRIWENNGDATFVSFAFPSVITAASVAVFDLTGDGKSDIIFGNGKMLVNTSVGGVMSFGFPSDISNIAALNGPTAMIPSDFDADGDLDLLVGDNFGANDVWRNDAGTLVYVGSFGSTGTLFSMHAIDANGDKYPDVIETSGQIYLGDGAGGFISNRVISASSGRSFATGDLDGDGDEDLIFGQFNPTRTLLSNLANPGNIAVNSLADSQIGGDGFCTLREAMTNGLGNTEGTGGDCAAGIAGTDTIRFDIPGTSLPFQISPMSALPIITGVGLYIDGETQSGAACGATIPARSLSIVINGASAGPVDGFLIQGDGATIRGLVVNGFGEAGIKIEGGSGNLIECSYIGTDYLGMAAVGNTGNGVQVTGVAVGNSIGAVGLGNIVSGNSDGIHFEPGTSGNYVRSNHVGTNRTGLLAIANTFTGVGNNQGGSLTIGGSGSGEGNLISGNRWGIGFNGGGATNGVIQGNKIGTDISGTLPLANTQAGITFGPNATGAPTDHLIGGTAAGEGNIIAFNTGEGIVLANDAGITGIHIEGNNISQNLLLGIDLAGDGATPNDSDDADSGPNNLQNWFQSDNRIDGFGNLVVTANSSSAPANSTYPLSIAVYEVDSDDEEGARYLSSVSYNSHPDPEEYSLGSAAALGIAVGSRLVVNVTDANGNSSEFGAAGNVQAVPQVEYEALVALYNSTNGASWTDNTNWLVGHEVDTWYGVSVVNGNVQTVSLGTNNLDGPLPEQMGNLTELRFLDLPDNNLTGSIPVELASMTELLSLTLSGNQLSGPVPDIFTNLTNLSSLWLNVNLLTGDLPGSLSSLTSLSTFMVAENSLTGPIPPSFSALTTLDRVAVENNLFSEFPSIVNSFPLSEFRVWNNFFNFDDLEPNAAEIDNVSITQRPYDDPSNLVLNTGDPINLSFPSSVGGTPAKVSHQWKKNGVALPGEVSETYVVGGASVGDAGVYTLESTNSDLPGLVLASETITLSVNAPSFLQIEVDALVALYNSAGGAAWNDNFNWTMGTDLSTWFGVTVTGGRVTRIELPANNMIGTIPTEIGDLALLEVLDLDSNLLNGSIPTSIGNLTSLTGLALGNNDLTGGIPVEIGTLTSLDNLYLHNNPLGGSLPTQIGNLTVLTTLQISGSSITGALPDEIGNLTELRYLNIDNNQFAGPFPTTAGNLINLIELTASNNLFNGSIPPGLFGIPTIQSLELAENQFSGPVLTTFSPLDQLSRLWLNDNALTSLPNFSSLPILIDFQVQNNNLVMSDLEPNEGIAGFQYAPQANFGTTSSPLVGSGAPYLLSFSPVGGANTLYQWFKDGSPVPPETGPTYGFNIINPGNAGLYTLEATNPGLPGLTLTSETITLFVSALVVTTTADDNTPGDEECTLREAILTANADADVTGGDCIPKGGFDRITFNIPGAGPHAILLNPALPAIVNAVLIDGYSQPGSSPNTQPFGTGTNAVIQIELDGTGTPGGTDGLYIETAGVIVRGLAIHSFPRAGIWIQQSGSPFEQFSADLLISDAAQTQSSDLTIGLSPTADENFDSGEDVAAPPAPPPGAFDVRLVASGTDLTSDFRSSTVEDHTWLIQYDVVSGDALIEWNLSQFPDYGALRLVDTIGGSVIDVDMRTRTSLLVPEGISSIELRYSLPVAGADNQIEGVFVGTPSPGFAARPNGQDGIVISGGSHNTIGGSDLDAVNLISGNTGYAIALISGASNNTIQNSYMGFNAPFSFIIPNGAGVFVGGAENLIGGTSVGDGNFIGFNNGPGVEVDESVVPGAVVGNSILGNRIYRNAGLGIDLFSIGSSQGLVDVNDIGDADSGANLGMNYPVLTNARYLGQTATLSGILETAPFSPVRLEFFTSRVCDPSGYGEGRYFLGHLDVVADGAGRAPFTASLSVAGIPGRFAAATATDVNGNTSEFSQCISPEIIIPSGYVLTRGDENIASPQGIDFASDGTVYVSSTGSGEVFRYDPDGNLIDGGPFIFGNGRPIDVAVTDNPKLFVSNLDLNGIYRFDLTTTTPGTDASLQPLWPSGLNGPTHMTLGPDGLLYYSEVRSAVGEKISRVDPEAAVPVPELVITFPDTEDYNPQGIAFADGYMYFSTGTTGQLLRADIASAPSLPLSLSETEVMFEGLDSPGGVDIGTDGDLYVATLSDIMTASVQSAVMVPFVSGLAGGFFNNLAFDAQGRLYYADGALGQLIEVIAPLAQVQSGGTMTYVIHEDGAPTISDGSDFEAVRAAFQNWTDVSTADVTFVDGGTTTSRYADAFDGENIVTFSDDAFPFPPFVLAVAA